jgi:phosphate-selective porin OprO and OprP
MKRKIGIIALAAFFGAVWTVEAEDTLQDKLDRLEQRYNILERKYENDQETAANKSKDAPSVTASPGDGFSLKNADKSFVLKLTGYTQLDGRFYLNDTAGSLADQFLIRRARFWFEGTFYKAVSVRIVPDFGGGTAALQDAYLNLNYTPEFQIRAGRFKVPLGLERLQSNNQTLFVEAAHSTSLTPNYDNGLQLHGDVGGGVFTYAVAYTNGAPDGSSVDGDTADGKDLSARIFVHPFKSGGSLVWKDLGFGVAAAKGRLVGASTATASGLSTFRTPGQQFFLTYSNAIVDGDRVRWSPQAYWYPGRFGFLGEYVVSSQDVRRVSAPLTKTTLTNRAWQAQASWALTGESSSYKGIKPL